MYLTVCPLRDLDLIADCGGVFQGIFPWLIALGQPIPSQRDRELRRTEIRRLRSHELFYQGSKDGVNKLAHFSYDQLYELILTWC